jgi:hypothetical protein
MCRILSTLLLSLLVLSAQQGSLAHAIAHGLVPMAPGEAGSSGAAAPAAVTAATAADTWAGANGKPDGQKSDAYCGTCFQFTHIAWAAAASLPQFKWLGARFAPALARGRAAICAQAPQRRNRGPPITL